MYKWVSFNDLKPEKILIGLANLTTTIPEFVIATISAWII